MANPSFGGSETLLAKELDVCRELFGFPAGHEGPKIPSTSRLDPGEVANPASEQGASGEPRGSVPFL
jgi:hypothetical protein